MKQCLLEYVNETDEALIFTRMGVYSMCWIDIPENVEVGNIISLKGHHYHYVVNEIYDVEIKKGEIKRNWKVGGL